MRPRLTTLIAVLMLVLAPAAGAETVGLPPDAGTGSSQNDLIFQVSCPAAGDCLGVGGYNDTGGHHQALIDSESDGVWSSSNVPDSSLPNAGSTPAPYLTAVGCTSVGNCVAGDAYSDSNNYVQGLIDSESDGSWTPLEAPLLGLAIFGAGPGAGVNLLACPAAGACVGIGNYYDDSDNLSGLIETQTPVGWSASEAPWPADATILSFAPSFYDVACADAGDCSAVGYYLDTLGNQQGLLETENAGTWSATELDLSNLSPAANPLATVISVSCPAAGSCTAVGTFQNAAGSNAAFEVDEVGGQWQQATALALPADASSTPVSSGTGSAPPQSDLGVNGVACASAGNCTAVGSYDATSANNVEAATWTDSSGTWSTGSTTSLPSGQAGAANPQAALDAVTCQSAGNCLAAGTYEGSAGVNVVLVARESGGGWSSAGANLAIPYDTSVGSAASVSCAAGGYCAVGGYVGDNNSNHDNAFMLDAPAAVAGLSATFSASQASVSWGAPADNGGLGVGAYTVTANDLTNPTAGGQTVSVQAPATSATIGGLASADTYTFTVSASSLLGGGLALTSGQVSASSPRTTTPPTRAQLRASLSTLLRPHGPAARLRRLRRTHRYSFRYRTLEPGRLTLRWYEVVRVKHHRRRFLAASAIVKPGAIRKITVTVALTHEGRRLVAHEHHLRLRADVSFKAGGVTVSRSAAFALR